MYSALDLLGAIGGLYDLFVIVFAILFCSYNTSLFLYNSITEIYKYNQPFTSFAKFFIQHKFKCLRKSENSEIIEKCEEALEQELNVNEVLKKLRQIDALINN